MGIIRESGDQAICLIGVLWFFDFGVLDFRG